MNQCLQKRGNIWNYFLTRVTFSYNENHSNTFPFQNQISVWLSPVSSLRRRFHSIWRENSRDTEETVPSSNTERPSNGSCRRSLPAIRMMLSATSGCTVGGNTRAGVAPRTATKAAGGRPGTENELSTASDVPESPGADTGFDGAARSWCPGSS